MSEANTQIQLEQPLTKLIRWSELPVKPINPMLSRAVVAGDQAMIAHIELKKGCVIPRHSHKSEQISWIVEGALVFKFGEEGSDDVLHVTAGDVLVIPALLPHAAEAIEDTIDYEIFAPPLQDWIDRE